MKLSIWVVVALLSIQQALALKKTPSSPAVIARANPQKLEKNTTGISDASLNPSEILPAESTAIASASTSTSTLSSTNSREGDYRDVDRENNSRNEDDRDHEHHHETPPPRRRTSSRRKNSKDQNTDQDRSVDVDRDADRDVDRDVDHDDDRRETRRPTESRRNRERGSSRSRDSSSRDQDNEEIDSNVDDDRYESSSRRYRHYDDDIFGSMFSPMFDMFERMPGYPRGMKKFVRDSIPPVYPCDGDGFRGGRGGSYASSSVSSSDGHDGSYRSVGTVSDNGRTRGFVAETGRDGRTRTKWFGENDEEDNRD